MNVFVYSNLCNYIMYSSKAECIGHRMLIKSNMIHEMLHSDDA